MSDDKIFLGSSGKPEDLYLAMANRHGLVTGATGTGKTVTLQIMAEAFSKAGVPVFAADVKGDLSGISEPGEPKDFLLERAKQVGLRGLWLRGDAHHLLGSLRHRGPSHPNDRNRNGAVAIVAPHGSFGCTGGRPQYWLQDCRPGRPSHP